MNRLKRWKPKVGDTLYGFYCGKDINCKPFDSIEVGRVGQDYIYFGFGEYGKLRIEFYGYCPQYDDLVAVDTDKNHEYYYYRTEKGAKKAFEAHKIRIKLRNHSFNESDDTIIHIANLLNLI